VSIVLLVGLSMGTWAKDTQHPGQISESVRRSGEWGKQVIAFVPASLEDAEVTGNVIDITTDALVFLPPSVQQSTVFPHVYKPRALEQEITAHYSQNLVIYAAAFLMIVIGTLQ